MLPPLTKLREFWSLGWPTVMVHKHAFCHDWQLISAGRLVRDLASGCSWVTASPAAPAQEPCSPVSFVLTLCSMCKLYRQHRDHWSRSWSYQGKADFFPKFMQTNLTWLSSLCSLKCILEEKVPLLEAHWNPPGEFEHLRDPRSYVVRGWITQVMKNSKRRQLM